MTTRLLAIALLALSLSADEVTESRRLVQEALAAQQQKDSAQYLAKMQTAAKLRPQHPGVLVQLASALAVNGRHTEALGVLQRVAAMGFVAPNVEAPVLAPVRALPAYAAVAKRFEANAAPTGTAKHELTIDRLGLIPEGIVYDAKRKRFLISSVRTKTIFAIDAIGAVSVFAENLPWGVFGMAVDGNVLWAATSAIAQTEGFKAEDEGKAALLRFELGSLESRTLSPAEGKHLFGDVTVSPDGEVFVSDSASPTIFHVVEDDHLEPWLRGDFQSLQGLAATKQTLYVADYSKGILAIDRRTRDVHVLRVPPNASLLGVDGLYVLDATTLIATQNGTNPNRILRIRLAPGGLAVTSVETLLANAPELGDPTLGVVVGKRFFFNANAQWNLFGEDGKIADPLHLAPAVVLSVPLR